MDNTQTKFNLFILGITIILMFLMACDVSQQQHSTNDTINTNDVFETDKELFSAYNGSYHYYKTTIKIDGIKHEYITVYGGRMYGITHYPECKYCKQKKEKQNGNR